MKVLQVILAFYPNKVWGGPPQNTYVLSKALALRGHQIHVLTTNILDYETKMSKNSFRADWNGLSVTYLNSYWWGKRNNSMGFIVAPEIIKYSQLIRESDIIHIHGYRHFLFVFVSLIARYNKVPYIIQARGALTDKFGRVGLKRLFDQTLGNKILQNAAYGISLSDEETEIYKRWGVSPSRVEKIYNPFDPRICPVLPDGLAFRDKYGIKPNEKILLFLARLHEKKGLDILIDAVAQLNRDDYRLCIVGPDGGYKSIAESIVFERRLEDRVLFIGPLYDEQKFDAYRAAHIYILPTRGGEGLPTTLIEACYSGLPIILTNTTEVAHIINNRVGLVVNYNSSELKSAIDTLIDDEDLHSYFRQQTKSFLNKYFDLDKAISKYERIYNYCTKSP